MPGFNDTELKTILITGASGGIGLELAKVCAAHGHDLVLVARSHERLKMIGQDLERDYNVKVQTIEQDLSQSGAAKKVADQAWSVDGLINNAGFGLGGRFEAEAPQRQHDMLMVNVVALTELARLILPGMVERGYGRVMNVASTAAFMPGPYMAVYYASKAYVLSLSRALAYELRRTEVKISALCPGPTKTHFADEAGVESTPLYRSPRVMDARRVAEAGYNGMIAGKSVIIPGRLNWLITQAPRILPYAFVLRTVNRADGGKS